MNARHLLLIAYYFPPWGMGGVQRPFKLAKYLPEQGWDVTVIAPETGAYHAHDASLLEELPNGVTVHRVPAGFANRAKGSIQSGQAAGSSGLLQLVARGIQQWLRWPDDKRGFAKRARKLAGQLAKDTRFDAVLTTSPPPSIHLAGMALARSSGIPWIADFRDPWLVRRDDWGPSLFHFLYNRRLRKRMLRRANGVLATSDTTANELSRQVKGRRVQTIPNGFDEADFANVTSGGGIDPLTIALYGTVSPSIGADQLFGVLGAFHDRYPEIEFRIRHIGVSTGVDAADLARVCGLSELFETTGYLPHRAAVRELMAADVVALSMPRDPELDGTIPGRTFEVLRSLKPILLCAPRGGALARLLDPHRGIWYFSPGDVRAGLAAVQGVLSLPRGVPVRTTESVAEFDRRHQAAQVAQILNDVCAMPKQVDVTA